MSGRAPKYVVAARQDAKARGLVRLLRWDRRATGLSTLGAALEWLPTGPAGEIELWVEEEELETWQILDHLNSIPQ